MEEYTHVLVKGNVYLPERFWERTFLTEKEAEHIIAKKPAFGFVRKINEIDRKILNEIMEKRS